MVMTATSLGPRQQIYDLDGADWDGDELGAADIISEALGRDVEEQHTIESNVPMGNAQGVARPASGVDVVENKHSKMRAMARLYREDGTPAPVPLEQAGRYLRRRNLRTGKPIFYRRPPREAAPMLSDPCPVTECGKRMANQSQLLIHITKLHGDEAHFLLSPEQRKRATGETAHLLDNLMSPVGDMPLSESARRLAAAGEAGPETVEMLKAQIAVLGGELGELRKLLGPAIQGLQKGITEAQERGQDAGHDGTVTTPTVSTKPVDKGRDTRPAFTNLPGHTCGLRKPGAFGSRWGKDCAGCAQLQAERASKAAAVAGTPSQAVESDE